MFFIAEMRVFPIYSCPLLELVMLFMAMENSFLLDAKMIFQPLGCYDEYDNSRAW